MGLDNPLHIAVIVVLVLLVFGARRLPEIGRSLGSGMREFKEAVTGESKPQATSTPTLGAGEQPQAPPPVPVPQPVATQPVASQAPQSVPPTPTAPAESQPNPFGQ
jgi:sec-independent protein translocase protein TatA